MADVCSMALGRAAYMIGACSSEHSGLQNSPGFVLRGTLMVVAHQRSVLRHRLEQLSMIQKRSAGRQFQVLLGPALRSGLQH